MNYTYDFCTFIVNPHMFEKTIGSKVKNPWLTYNPTVSKVVFNFSTKKVKENPLLFLFHLTLLECVTGSKAQFTRAKNSIAGFDLKEDTLIGCKLEMRFDYAYEFFTKFNETALAKLPYFNGYNEEEFVDQVSLNIRDIYIFPEFEYDSEQWGEFYPGTAAAFNMDIICNDSNTICANIILSHLG